MCNDLKVAKLRDCPHVFFSECLCCDENFDVDQVLEALRRLCLCFAVLAKTAVSGVFANSVVNDVDDDDAARRSLCRADDVNKQTSCT